MHEVRLCIFYTEKGCVVVEMKVMYEKKTWLSCDFVVVHVR